jgi:glycosyltransferase involved in cell wall biosynthesis
MMRRAFRLSSFLFILSPTGLGGRVLKYTFAQKAKVGAELVKYNMRFLRWARRASVDVVYANDLRALYYVALASRIGRLPLIWYVRGEISDSCGVRLGFAVADSVIFIADGVMRKAPDDLLARYGDRISVLNTGFRIPDTCQIAGPNGTLYRQRYRIPETAHVIGLVASVVRNKGHDLALLALAKLVQRFDAHLVFIGDTAPGHEAYRDELNMMIDRLRLAMRVHWVGFQGTVDPFYSMMDVLILPSRSEGLPRVVVEGLAAGLPVVATDVGGVSDIIVSPDLGRVVQAGNVDQLAAAIEDVLDDEVLRSSSAASARREYVQNRFSIQAYVAGFISIVNRLLTGTGR